MNSIKKIQLDLESEPVYFYVLVAVYADGEEEIKNVFRDEDAANSLLNSLGESGYRVDVYKGYKVKNIQNEG